MVVCKQQLQPVSPKMRTFDDLALFLQSPLPKHSVLEIRTRHHSTCSPGALLLTRFALLLESRRGGKEGRARIVGSNGNRRRAAVASRTNEEELVVSNLLLGKVLPRESAVSLSVVQCIVSYVSMLVRA